MNFRDRYEWAVRANNSMLCVGLDPDPRVIPSGVSPTKFLRSIIETTQDLVCAYKPNSAFFEANGSQGFAELKALIADIPSHIPVILDVKRGDVASTSEFYAKAAFEYFGAHAITATIYQGLDSLEPFTRSADQFTFVCCLTSNDGAAEFQKMRVIDEETGEERFVYQKTAALAQRLGDRHNNVGLVVGATRPEDAQTLRGAYPEMLFLVPGVGAQGGDLERAVRSTIDASGGGILVNASRSILYAGQDCDDYGSRYASYAAAEAENLRARIAQLAQQLVPA